MTAAEGLAELAGLYDIAYIDVPWPMYGPKDKDAAAGKHYDLMSMEEVCAMPIRKLFRAKGCAFVWATCPRLDLAIDAIRAWGLHYRGIPFVWAKTRKDGVLINGQGVPPTSTKPTTELCLLATTHRTGRPFPLLTSAMRQVVPHARGKHSEKPAIIRDHIVQLYGDRPRIELFARGGAVGWDAWGNQAPIRDPAPATNGVCTMLSQTPGTTL